MVEQQQAGKLLVCVDCGNEFEFTTRDQEFYKLHGYVDPKRCYPCRKKKKARFSEREQSEKVYVGDQLVAKV